MNAMYVVFLWGESMNLWNYHCLFATPSLDQKKICLQLPDRLC